MVYFVTVMLVLMGIFSTRWNVVIGGQLFSKSLRGLTYYKTQLLGLEGLLSAAALLILPFVILWILTVILPPWPDAEAKVPADEAAAGL
jgi:predicted membrane protein